MGELKMAKATQADIEAAIELYQFLRCIRDGRSASEVVDEFGYDEYASLLDGQASDVEFLLRAEDKGCLFRVVWGMQVLLDPRNEILDPDAPHLALHPKYERMQRELADLRARVEVLERLARICRNYTTCEAQVRGAIYREMCEELEKLATMPKGPEVAS